MFKYLFFKLIGKKTSNQINQESKIDQIKEEGNKFIGIISNFIIKLKEESITIRKKFKNLRDTNYKLGLSHIERGNLSDANLRFSIIIKFWPDFKEAYYQKAYVCMLENDPKKAKLVVNRLQELFPNYQDQSLNDLICKIDLAIENANKNE